MEELTFEEWEWPPGTERRFLIEPFRSKFKFAPGSRSTLACTIPYHPPYATDKEPHHLMFVRPGKGAEIVGAVPDLEVPPLYIIAEHEADGQARPKVFKPNTIRSHLENYLRRLPESYGYYRYFNLDNHSSPVRCLIADEVGFCTDTKNRSCEFYFLKRYSQQTPLKLYQWLLGQLAQPDSSINFALHWASLDRRQQYELLWNYTPALSQLHRLLLAIARIQPEFTPSLIFYWRSKTLAFSGSQVTGAYPGGYPVQDKQRIKQLAKWAALIREFYPMPQLHPTSTPLCIVNQYKALKECAYISESTPCTEHERLEAYALLRDWLQGKASPEDIEMLLPS